MSGRPELRWHVRCLIVGSVVQANCRVRFTAADFDFVVRSLARREKDAVSLVELLTDAEERDRILDHSRLVEAVLGSTEHLTISPQLYFYILSRHVLCGAGIDDRGLCDYVASMLEHFSRTEHLRGGVYVSDLLAALREASPSQAFLLQAHVGNYSLFLTGMFPGNVERRSRRGAPDCSFYEAIGSASYRALASHQAARRWGLEEIFEALAAQFHHVRVALNGLADRLLHLDAPATLPILG